MAYTTIVAVRRYMGGVDEDKVPDDIITAYIAAAEEIIDEYCRHDWNLHAGEVEYHDGNAREKLILRHYPVVAINSIKKRSATGQDTMDPYDPISNEGDYLLHKAGAAIIRFLNGKPPFNLRYLPENPWISRCSPSDHHSVTSCLFSHF